MLELCRNGRATNAKIAQELGISVPTVAKKINSMLRDGVIAIKAIPSPANMGYKAAAFIGLTVDLKQIDNICAQLVDNIHINLLVTCFGGFNILLIVYFQDWPMLETFIKEELPGIKGVNRINTYLISEAKKRYHEILPDGLAVNKSVTTDAFDQLLIKELIRNGRPNFIDLADKLHVNVSTISRRIAALLKSEIIEIMAVPNPAKIGYSASAFVLLHVDLSRPGEICDELSGYAEVHLVMRLMNDYDILFGVNTSDNESLYDFLKTKIANIDGVLSMDTLVRGNFLYFSADAMFMPAMRGSIAKTC